MTEPSPTRLLCRGRIPRLVLVCVLAIGALGAAWSVITPLGEGPDEVAHLSLVLHLAEGEPFPDYDQLFSHVGAIRLCYEYTAATRACPKDGEEVTRASIRPHLLANARPKDQRLAWDEVDGATRLNPNQMAQHPPLYYQAMSVVLRVERAVLGAPMSLDRELALLRLVNVALLMPLPLLSWWAARRFGMDQQAASLAAVATLGVPMLSHIGATLNNDNLLTLIGFGLVAVLSGVVRGNKELKSATAVGVLCALALLTKASAVVFPPLIVLAYLIGWVSSQDRAQRPTVVSWIKPLALGSVVTAIGGSWWYLGVHHRTGSFVPSIESTRINESTQPLGFEPDMVHFFGEFTSTFTQRFWGSFGWYTVRIELWLAIALTAMGAAIVVAALWPRVSAEGSSRPQRLFLIAPVVLFSAFVFMRAWNLHVISGQYPFIQGRYLFGGLVGVFVLVAIAASKHLGRWAGPAICGFAVVIQLDALRRCLQTWWGAPDIGPRGQMRAMVAWSGWPGEFVWLLIVGAVVAVGWLAVEVAREVSPLGSESQ